MLRGIFFTGTSTEVGKTYVAAMIARELHRAGQRVGVYKPVASGCVPDGDTLVSEDAVQLWEAAGRPGDLAHVCPQTFIAPLAPHLAARAEGRELDPELLRSGADYWRDRCDVLLVEGAGGLMSPLGDDEYVIDLAADLGFPLVVVAANRLGVINQTLQTLVTAYAHGNQLEVVGVILNDVDPRDDDPSSASNLEELRNRCVPPVLAHVACGAPEFAAPVNWYKVAREPAG